MIGKRKSFIETEMKKHNYFRKRSRFWWRKNPQPGVEPGIKRNLILAKVLLRRTQW